MNSTTKSKIFVIALVIIAVILGVSGILSIRQTESEHVKEINRVIAEKGGEVASINTVSLEESPFQESPQGNTIYHITYTKAGKSHTAWYLAVNHSSIKQVPEAWKFDD